MALDCTKCIACCLYEGVLPIQEKADGVPIAEVYSKADANEPFPVCVWLVREQASIDSGPCGKCKHYDRRPKICSDFEKGGQKCLRSRKLTQIKAPREATRA